MRVVLSSLIAGPVLLVAVSAAAQTWTLSNPSARSFADEPVRLGIALPDAVTSANLVVKADDREVPYLLDEENGKKVVWVLATVESGKKIRYAALRGTPDTFTPRVKVMKVEDGYVLDNDLIAVKVPLAAGSGIPGPIYTFRLAEGNWVGASSWKTDRKLTKFSATPVGDGRVMGRVRLRYEFEGKTGLNGEIPSFAEITLTLAPNWKHVEIAEDHEMSRGDSWELDLSKGWAPRQGVSKPFSGGFSGGPPPARDLRPYTHISFAPDMFINLFPRWNQHCKDGWAFTATDNASSAGAVVVRAGRWYWPHQNAIVATVRESGTYAGLRCPTWKGRRLWWLANSAEPASTAYVSRYAWTHLDKIVNEMILDWPDMPGTYGGGMNFYDGGQMNPTGGIRGAGRSAVSGAGRAGNYGTLADEQTRIHPDAYGSYWLYWSPENPNFFSDFFKVPVGLACNLKGHPRFNEISREAALRVMEDLYHSVTLPGGAGQECPGYMGYALSHIQDMAALCKTHLGFEHPNIQERVQAGSAFLRRISQPDGAVRRMLPMGDTHPAKDGPRVQDVPADEVARWTTVELPGFGAVFTSKPGTAQETYLAFKSGPNRGHYHGEQLAFHYCANARPTAVDHHCSYHPRAGQEHMHNRVAFGTEEFPYANMDGFERLLAFKTSPDADLAVGQVESDRLRKVKQLPSEDWHAEYPQRPFSKPLVYRRTVVLVKNGPEDYFVFRDQYWCAVPLQATYCLHILTDNPMERKNQTVAFDRATLFCAQPAEFAFDSLPWEHANGGREATQGARLSIKGDKGEFITVLYPGTKTPELQPIPGGVKVGNDEITFAGDQPSAGDAATYAVVKRNGKELLTLTGKDLNPDRSQGEVGLFVPDAGYPFGEIPDWLIRQRSKLPDWAPEFARQARKREIAP